LVTRIPGYDIKRNKLLPGEDRFFVADHSFIRQFAQNADTGDPETLGYVIQNIIAQELKRRGYAVYHGIYENESIDFVGVREENAGAVCLQVLRSVLHTVQGTDQTDRSDGTVAAKTAALLRLPPGKKIGITIPAAVENPREGITYKTLPQFLLTNDLTNE
jgi:predicted AAA+ superfamily ATPase